MLDSVFGLPLHPLVVHAAVVLVPLVSIGAWAMALSVRLSRRFGVLITILAWVSLVATALSKLSGEEMSEQFGTPQPHAELADPTPVIVLLLAILVTALWLFDRGRPTNRSRPVLVVILAVLTAIVAAYATYQMIRVGHSGAEAVWSSRR